MIDIPQPCAPARGTLSRVCIRAAAALAAALMTLTLLPATGVAQDNGPECPVDNPPAPFTDRGEIPRVHRGNVDCAYNAGIIRGFPDGTYRPSWLVRRDQMATLIAGALEAAGVELPAPTGERFADVPAGSPHSEAIHRLAAADIVRGGPGGQGGTVYGPGLRVRRDQMASLLIRAAEFATGRILQIHTEEFSDVPPSNAHFANVNGAARHGLVHGYPDGTYRPGAGTRRDQTASLAVRLMVFIHTPQPPLSVTFTSHQDGDTVPVGDVTVAGESCTFEATVFFTLIAPDGSQTNSFTTADNACWGQWEHTFTLATPGEWTIRASGEGQEPAILRLEAV